MINKDIYKQSCPNCFLTYQQFLRSIQIMFKRRFGFYPRDQQISACGAYDVPCNGKIYVHGSIMLGDWVYEFDFLPITAEMFTPSYGMIPLVSDVYDWVLEQIWHKE